MKRTILIGSLSSFGDLLLTIHCRKQTTFLLSRNRFSFLFGGQFQISVYKSDARKGHKCSPSTLKRSQRHINL